MKFIENLICPICGKNLFENNRSLLCESGHCFDISKEGYVNLLFPGGKSGDLTGDNRDMARCRHEFLNKGYFHILANSISDYVVSIGKSSPVMLDICCGEGYYSEKLLEKQSGFLYGFDLSRSMVRLAAKRKLDASFFVANLSHIPFKTGSADIAIHLFAPFHENEFSRVLKSDGCLITVVPGKNHLFELKERVYDQPYKNDEKLPEASSLTLKEKFKVSGSIFLDNSEDIETLFKMTPYYYRTSAEGKKRLQSIHSLETTVEFVAGVYEKSGA